MPLQALLLISIRDALLTTYALLPSHLSVDSSRKPQALILIILDSEDFYCRRQLTKGYKLSYTTGYCMHGLLACREAYEFEQLGTGLSWFR